MKNIILILTITLLITSCKKDEETVLPDGIRYTVTFSINWNSSDFPTDYPSNAHFSPLIGWSHKANHTFFQVGTIASSGIEVMAETGKTSPLIDELNTKVANGEGHHTVIGSGLSSGVGEISVDIIVNEANPSVTLATMVAPSPDWYVAVVNVNLLDDGNFVTQKTVDAHVYDSGTDDGVTYTSADADSDPKVPISLFVDAPMGNGTELNEVIGEVKFTKQ